MLAALDPRVWLIAAVLMLGTATGAFFYGRSDGKAVESAAWLQEKQKIQTESAKLLADTVAKNAIELQNQRDLAKKASDDYEAKILDIDAQYKLVDHSRGLRIPITNRCADASKTSASGPSESHETTPNNVVSEPLTERIPAVTEERLYALAKLADELSAQLKALQEWVRANGLY
jgi:hypothetical protein